MRKCLSNSLNLTPKEPKRISNWIRESEENEQSSSSSSIQTCPIPSHAHSITMNSLHAHLLLLAVCCVGYIASSPVIGQDQRSGDSDADVLLAADEMTDNGGDNIDKRVERYAFGLGRRAYMYSNGGPGMKRLPVYNFGLGKRSRPYSFGLGKRSDYDYDQDNEIDYRVPPANYLAAERAVRPGRQNKRTTRPQPFNFGLGRR